MRRFVVIALLAVLVAACGAGTTTTKSSSSSTSTVPIGSSPSASTSKAPIVGLIDKGSESSYHLDVPYPVVDTSEVGAKSPAFSGIVVNQNWSQLEPSQNTFDFTVLDASLAAVAAYNAQHAGAPLGVRLRVFGAYAAPEWAKMLDGAPITIPPHLPGNTGGTLGQWWRPAYRSAWAALQKALAARYDRDPLLREIAVSSCSTLTAEPFVMAPGTISAAKAYGWTTNAQQACLDGAFADYAPWTHTAIYYPMSPLNGSQQVTNEVMQRCVDSEAKGGPRCILANNALNPVSATTGRSAPTYVEMNDLWTADPSRTLIAFQMDGPNNATYCAAIGVAVSHHALSVELWPAVSSQVGGFTSVPTASLVAWSQALRDRKAPNCTGS